MALCGVPARASICLYSFPFVPPEPRTSTYYMHVKHFMTTPFSINERVAMCPPSRPVPSAETNAPMCILSESFVIKRLHSEQKITRLTVNHKVTKQVGGCSFAGGFLEGGGGWLVSGQRAHVYNTHTQSHIQPMYDFEPPPTPFPGVSGPAFVRECVFFGWA